MSEPTDRDRMVARLEQVNRHFSQYVRLNKEMGVEIGELQDGAATTRLAWREDLVGNPATGVLHGGVITTLLDATCGLAVFMALPEPDSMATLDLRIDYLRPATPRRDVQAVATCYRMTRSVAFVRGRAHHGDPDRAIATCQAAFMLGTPLAQPREEE